MYKLPLVIVTVLLGATSSLRSVVEGDCSGKKVGDKVACGGGKQEKCDNKYVQLFPGEYAQCHEDPGSGNCLTTKECDKPTKICKTVSSQNNQKYTGNHWKLPGPKDNKRVTFKVKANNDAHVGFFGTKKETKEVYEIVIGGWGDSQSVIRQCNQCKNEVTKSTKNVNGNGYEQKEFWADCKAGTIRWGRGNTIGEDVMQEWTDPSPHDCEYFDVMTGWGSTGEWEFCMLQ